MNTTNPNHTSNPAADGADRETRRTVIPTPRRDGGIFPGWGVRF
jgi:hypothetical protein